MTTYDVHLVFTPTSPTTFTFVEREGLNKKLVDALRTLGKQLVVFGRSGSGKTTLIKKKLSQVYEAEVTTICMSEFTFDDLILNAFDQLDPFYEAEKVNNQKKGISSSIGASYMGIKAEINAQSSKQTQTIKKRILPPQLSPQRLANFIGEAKCCWILEDFHRISDKEKIKLAEVMKVFADISGKYKYLKIIAIGAAENAREIIQYDEEIQNCVVEVHVPFLMTESEIKKIINKGEKLLNISMSKDTKKDIIKHSSGIASVCHQLCLNICLSSGIYETEKTKEDISTADFESALRMYIDNESSIIKTAFNQALRQTRRLKYDYCRLIIESLSYSDAHEGLKKDEIEKEIRNKEPSCPMKYLNKYLKQLQIEKCGSVVQYDAVSGKYSFHSPYYKIFALALFSKVK